MDKEKKLKALWIAFEPIPCILEEISPGERIVTGGWLQGISNLIVENEDISLAYCFQYHREIEGEIGNVKYYSMPCTPVVKRKTINQYKVKDFERFKRIISEVEPDIIHIFGTETWFQRQFAYMLRDMSLIDRTIVWIQGLTGHCANVYSYGLDSKYKRRTTLWEFIRGTNIIGIENRLSLNGKGERQEIQFLKNVFVRTEWDRACCKAINSRLIFYNCNETLRPSFYEDKLWNFSEVDKYTIFMSQYTTPLKGFIQMLRALEIVKKSFPDVILYTTGCDLFEMKSKFEALREPSYFKTLREEIINRKLKDNICFLGKLRGDEMRDRYIKSHVFVSASTIENSPNSVGEAMILGVPTIASDVGGVSSMASHKEEALLYPFSEYTVLAEYICQVFESSELAKKMSKKARERALVTHNQEKNYSNLLDCYKRIAGNCDMM